VSPLRGLCPHFLCHGFLPDSREFGRSTPPRGSEIGPKMTDSGAKIAQNCWLIKYIHRELAYTRAYSVGARRRRKVAPARLITSGFRTRFDDRD
jgi:hypothetical protein